MSHLDPRFLAEHARGLSNLRQLLGATTGEVLLVAGGGSFAMEACVRSLIAPGDAVLVLVSGLFGRRIADMVRLAGADVDVVECGPLDRAPLQQVAHAFATRRYQAFCLVHGETSTGVLETIAPMAAIARDAGALVILDVVSTVGGVPTAVQSWRVDAAFASVQKCLGAPPGLGLVWLSERALARERTVRGQARPFCLDLGLARGAHARNEAAHYTPPVSTIRALAVALDEIVREGVENVYRRHRDAHARLVEGCERIGLAIPVPDERRLPTVTLVEMTKYDPETVRKLLARMHGIFVSPGLGELNGKALRIGLMASEATNANADRLVAALEECVNRVDCRR